MSGSDPERHSLASKDPGVQQEGHVHSGTTERWPLLRLGQEGDSVRDSDDGVDAKQDKQCQREVGRGRGQEEKRRRAEVQ